MEETSKNLQEVLSSESVLSFLPLVLAEYPEAEWYLVGGAVRDHAIGRLRSKDFDFVVRNVDLDKLAESLSLIGKVNMVGRDFGVIRFTPHDHEFDEPIDIAWPRTEKTGGSGGYRDFDVQADAHVSLERDLVRRDFTMNAVAWDVRKHTYIDPHNGLGDIEKKLVRTVGVAEQRFAEDMTRVLRCVRLACELRFDIDEDTWKGVNILASRLSEKHEREVEGHYVREYIVSRETVAKNFVRAFATDPLRALDLFERSGMLFDIIPDLKALRSTTEECGDDVDGNLWLHTKLAMEGLKSEEFAAMFPGEKPSVEAVVAVLLHGLAKLEGVACKRDEKVFYAHNMQGTELVGKIAVKLRLSTVTGHDIDEQRLIWLMQMQMFPTMVDIDNVQRTTLVKYFLSDKKRGRELLHLAFADAYASPSTRRQKDIARLKLLKEEVDTIEASGIVHEGKIDGLLSGREIMEELELGSGPKIGKLLNAIHEAQLKDEIATDAEAKELLKRIEEE